MSKPTKIMMMSEVEVFDSAGLLFQARAPRGCDEKQYQGG